MQISKAHVPKTKFSFDLIVFRLITVLKTTFCWFLPAKLSEIFQFFQHFYFAGLFSARKKVSDIFFWTSFDAHVYFERRTGHWNKIARIISKLAKKVINSKKCRFGNLENILKFGKYFLQIFVTIWSENIVNPVNGQRFHV